ncbi:MAG: hypothetical protein ABI595_08805 [Actinomycetota bacterium]
MSHVTGVSPGRMLGRRQLVVALAFVMVCLVTMPASATAFSDSFNRSAGALGSPWTTANSTWGVRSNRAKVLTAQYAAGIGYAVRPFVSTNFTVSADITLSPTYRRANAGLTLLFVSHANNIYCKIEVTPGNPNGLMSIGRRRGGVTTSLLAKIRNTGFMNGRTYKVACGRTGNVIRMTVGTLSITYTLTADDIAAFGSATNVGLRCHSTSDEDDGLSTYDNFSAVT